MIGVLMEEIQFEGEVKAKYIQNIKAAHYVASLDFWIGSFGAIFFLVCMIFSSQDLSYYSIFCLVHL